MKVDKLVQCNYINLHDYAFGCMVAGTSIWESAASDSDHPVLFNTQLK